MSTELQNVKYRPEHCNMVGVYRLQVGDHFYLGSTSRMGARRSAHLQALRAGEHHSPKLQAAWDFFEDAEFIIIQEVRPKSWDKEDTGRDRARMLEHEQIQIHFGTEFCCNQSSSAYSNSGIGDFLKARWQEEGFRAKAIERLKARRGVLVTKDTRFKMALAKTGAKNAKARACTLTLRGVTMEFETASAAAIHFGVPQQAMHLWLSGEVPWPGEGRLPRNAQAKTLVGLRGEYAQGV